MLPFRGLNAPETYPGMLVSFSLSGDYRSHFRFFFGYVFANLRDGLTGWANFKIDPRYPCILLIPVPLSSL